MPRPLEMVAGGVTDRGPRTPAAEGVETTAGGAGTEPAEKYEDMERDKVYNSYLASLHPAGWQVWLAHALGLCQCLAALQTWRVI